MDQDSGGKPHINVGKPLDPEDRVELVYVLVATDRNGGEGIYGHKINDNMHNFVTQYVDIRDALEKYLRDHGTVEVCRREGIKLEWRTFTQIGEAVQIT